MLKLSPSKFLSPSTVYKDSGYLDPPGGYTVTVEGGYISMFSDIPDRVWFLVYGEILEGR